MNSRQLFKDIFQKKPPPGIIFMPLICSFAAKIRQISVKDMLNNPNYLSNCQKDALRLFKYDTMLNVFDTSLEAEALGCGVEWESNERPPRVISHPLEHGESLEALHANFIEKGRMPVVLEATKRMTTLMSKHASVIGVITGPLTIGSHLRGECFLNELKKGLPASEDILEFSGLISLKIASMYCELNVDAILMVEEVAGKAEVAVLEKSLPVYESVLNTVHYYERPLLILARECEENQINVLCSINADGLILGQPRTASLKEISDKVDVSLAYGIPEELFLSTPDEIRDKIIGCLGKSREEGRGVIMATEWEIPYSTPVQNIHEFVKVLKEVLL